MTMTYEALASRIGDAVLVRLKHGGPLMNLDILEMDGRAVLQFDDWGVSLPFELVDLGEWAEVSKTIDNVSDAA